MPEGRYSDRNGLPRRVLVSVSRSRLQRELHRRRRLELRSPHGFWGEHAAIWCDVRCQRGDALFGRGARCGTQVPAEGAGSAQIRRRGRGRRQPCVQLDPRGLCRSVFFAASRLRCASAHIGRSETQAVIVPYVAIDIGRGLRLGTYVHELVFLLITRLCGRRRSGIKR